MRGPLLGLSAFLLLSGAITACQERLTAPADCPELCPGGNVNAFDTIITTLPGSDSSVAGYISRGSAVSLLVSNAFPDKDARALYRFSARDDSVEVRDTLRAYTVDSVLIGLTLLGRDTLVDGLKVYLFRLPSTVTVDSNTTFAAVEPELNPANIIDSILVPDTLNSGTITTTLRGADVAKVDLPVGTGGVLSMGVAMAAPIPTGIRLGSLAGGTAASFVSYVTLDIPDTGAIRQPALSRGTAFNTFVTSTTVEPDTTLITLGGEPSSRALLRFDLPQRLEDSATIVRATLELIPVTPIVGVPRDPALLQARAVLADLGAKSPVTGEEQFIGSDTVSAGSADTVRLDVTRIVQLWQSSDDLPEAVSLVLLPEAGTFTRAIFGSSRNAASAAARLRVTYLLSFPFENP